jgi:molybdate transport system ATP-binding protein
MIEAQFIKVVFDGNEIIKNVSFEIEQGEFITIIGASGSGKTTLGRLLAGELEPNGGIFERKKNIQTVFVPQQDDFFAQSGLQLTYYSQRYEYFEGSQIPTVADLLKINQDWKNDIALTEIISLLHIEYLLHREILLLSNGQRKRTQLAQACLKNADVYIFDQPFLGLDVHSQEVLQNLLLELKSRGKTIILITNPKWMPTSTDKVFEIENGTISTISSFQEYKKNISAKKGNDPLQVDELHLPVGQKNPHFGDVVKMTNVSVKRGDKIILQNINWTIQDGERWLLSGPNGSGKSTLLSLITGDNPQAYGNDIVLFGKKRGSGESIWDIKRRIGFVSPELHLYFLRQTKLTGLGSSFKHSVKCLDVVLSGFNDEVGSVSHASSYQLQTAKDWLHALGLSELKTKQFADISQGEQRMLLLVRALIKNPPLLILDEPCQGIDPEHSQRFIHLLDIICQKLNTTLIYVTHAADEVPSCVTHRFEL